MNDGIQQISVTGYKSLAEKQSVDIRPLTLLAGANSSGKSSLMQPLLLLKQTLEQGYDPGPLLLDGPHIRLNKTEQLFWRGGGERAPRFTVALANRLVDEIEIDFEEQDRKLVIPRMHVRTADDTLTLNDPVKDPAAILQNLQWSDKHPATVEVIRTRCFLMPSIRSLRPLGAGLGIPAVWENSRWGQVQARFAQEILSVLHLPGLRGNPARSYPVSAVGPQFPGTFGNYAASLILQWKAEKNPRLEALSDDLRDLGLTWKVIASPINDTEVEIQVGRLPGARRGGASDLVNIADVGFGLSQTLPVLVALHAARPGQIVYLEQPEIHLHPKAQRALAKTLAKAAQRGVSVVAETHSSLLLLGVQALVAGGDLPPELVKLHWFQRDDEGKTMVTSADLTRNGEFGDWPEDFADVELEAQRDYLDAVVAHQHPKGSE